eukprot:m.725046 g.725046  ORF g.725046 m.725046 type:complete len:118 (-) comp23025_c2_seq45:510-863(-)
MQCCMTCVDRHCRASVMTIVPIHTTKGRLHSVQEVGTYPGGQDVIQSRAAADRSLTRTFVHNSSPCNIVKHQMHPIPPETVPTELERSRGEDFMHEKFQQRHLKMCESQLADGLNHL